MKSFRRDDLEREVHPGRFIQRAMGRGKQFSPSEHFTIGFATFSAEARSTPSSASWTSPSASSNGS